MQQERHGLALAREGAAIVVSDEEATSARIANEADRILKDPDALGKMKVATRRLGRPDAAERLAAVVREAAR
jgi:UDP-N-acetylglucosamine--N-acetylmuramyl-(pentapeptide) pyrophosphoryl-undecaprenol N-acetylglucosamine transferase